MGFESCVLTSKNPFFPNSPVHELTVSNVTHNNSTPTMVIILTTADFSRENLTKI